MEAAANVLLVDTKYFRSKMKAWDTVVLGKATQNQVAPFFKGILTSGQPCDGSQPLNDAATNNETT